MAVFEGARFLPEQLSSIQAQSYGNFELWSTNTANIQALNEARPLLTRESRRFLDTYSKSRNSRLLPRLMGIRKAGVYRQTRVGRIGLLTASLLNKL